MPLLRVTASPVCRFINKERLGYTDIVPSTVLDMSTPDRLAALWVGTADLTLKVSAVTSFTVDDLHITTTVTLENVGAVPLYEVDYMRNINPNQGEVLCPLSHDFPNEVEQCYPGKIHVCSPGQRAVHSSCFFLISPQCVDGHAHTDTHPPTSPT